MTWLAEIGLLALSLSFFTALVGVSGFSSGNSRFSGRLVQTTAALITLSFAMLVATYAASDFSVVNVYENSHSAKPMLYKITGTWGNHEGSMLLWVMFLAWFAAAHAWRSARHDAEKSATQGMMGALLAGFTLFILLTSNPFSRLNPPPMEGKDLNPLLQDIGLAMHPPLLYLGYVGFAVVFAQAVAALWRGQPIDSAWAKQVRPWCLLAWAFLTAGIGLGSWWAYRELGWGGWWFWDPVENISLLPWLSGTALLHCLLVLSKRPMLQNWTLLLAIFTFAFSLMGTFLVRSGLLTSVHSFASDPTRGLYILAFVTLMVGGALWLYAARYPKPSEPDFLPVSREGGIVLNNLLLATICGTVFLGIIYPILMQVFDMPSVSVGAPFYNMVVVPIALPLLLVAGVAPLLAWKQSNWQASRRLLRHACIAFVVVAAVACLLFMEHLPAFVEMPLALLAGACGAWMLAASVVYTRKLWRANNQRFKASDAGVMLAHTGIAVFALAAAFASAGRVEVEQRVDIGSTVPMAGYNVQVESLHEQQKDNYLSQRAIVHLHSADGRSAISLQPEIRFFSSRGMETAESSVHGTIQKDVYAAIATAPVLSDSDTQKKRVILRLYIIPAMFWIWLGFALASLGGLIAAYGYFRES